MEREREGERNVLLRCALVCALVQYVHMCGGARVAEAFEGCRGLRGTRGGAAGWRRMYGPFAGWL